MTVGEVYATCLIQGDCRRLKKEEFKNMDKIVCIWTITVFYLLVFRIALLFIMFSITRLNAITIIPDIDNTSGFSPGSIIQLKLAPNIGIINFQVLILDTLNIF